MPINRLLVARSNTAFEMHVLAARTLFHATLSVSMEYGRKRQQPIQLERVLINKIHIL